MLGESVFDADQPRFYVILDRLDENWVDDHFRYRLIKALIETINEVNTRMRGVKVVIAIRRDLLDRVIHETRDTGFQEEKYEPLYLNLKWTKEQLFDLLDLRVKKLVRRRYTGGTVTWSDLMSKAVNKQRSEDYVIERTMYRPRDLIVFFNLCIEQAVGKPDITSQMILHAEGEYSQKRLRSLYDEWHGDYPELIECVALLKRAQARFPLSTINMESVEEVCLNIAGNTAKRTGIISKWANLVIDQKMAPTEFRARIAEVFYRVGLIGLKTETGTSISWSFVHAPVIPVGAIKEDCTVAICPVFYRALSIHPGIGNT